MQESFPSGSNGKVLTMMKIKIIPPNQGDEIHEREFDECPSLEVFQSLVDGYVEILNVKSNGSYKQLLLNEDGVGQTLRKKLNVNVNLGPYVQGISGGFSGVIVGTAVLIEEGAVD